MDLSAFGSAGAYECVFDPGVRCDGEKRVVVMGLYPPAGSRASSQHENATSKAIAAVMGHRAFDWVDLFPFAPHGKCSDVDMDALREIVETRSSEALALVLSWHDRLNDLVCREHACDNSSPVVVWAGEIVNLAREWLYDTGRLRSTDEYSTPWARIVSTTRFISVEDAVHPSAHLVAGGEERARALFGDTYSCAEALRRAPRGDAADLAHAMGDAAASRRDDMIRALTTLDVPHTAGWLSPELRRLRLVAWGAPGVTDAFVRLKHALGLQRFLAFLQVSGLYARLTEDGVVDALVELVGELGKDAFVTVMSDSVASRLTDPAFLEAFRALLSELGKDAFVTVMCDGVASRLTDPVFMEAFRALLSDLGKDAFVTVMCDGVAARLTDPAFMSAFRALLSDLGKDAFVTLMSNSLAARLTDPAFMVAFRALLSDLGKDAFVTVMCDGVASRLTDPAFMEAFRALLSDLGKDAFITVMCGGVAARLTDPAFMEAFRALLSDLGKDAFVTVMSGSVAARLTNPVFMVAFRALLSDMGKDAFVIVMCDSVAARLTDPAFMEAFRALLSDLGKDAFVTVMSGSVAARLTDPAFMNAFRALLSDLGKEKVVKVMCDGIAARLHVLGDFMRFYNTCTTWTQKMTRELCRRVPLKQTTPVHESVWLDVHATMLNTRGGARKKQKV